MKNDEHQDRRDDDEFSEEREERLFAEIGRMSVDEAQRKLLWNQPISELDAGSMLGRCDCGVKDAYTAAVLEALVATGRAYWDAPGVILVCDPEDPGHADHPKWYTAPWGMNLISKAFGVEVEELVEAHQHMLVLADAELVGPGPLATSMGIEVARADLLFGLLVDNWSAIREEIEAKTTQEPGSPPAIAPDQPM